MTLADWLRMNDHPETSLVVAVNEECGYRYWLWVFHGTEAELRAAWLSGKAPTNFWNPSEGEYPGVMVQVEWDQFTDTEPLRPIWDEARAAGLYAHVHTDEDTYLIIRGEEVL
jgi:hypothetical protein